jgi:hypothetical protein
MHKLWHTRYILRELNAPMLLDGWKAHGLSHKSGGYIFKNANSSIIGSYAIITVPLRDKMAFLTNYRREALFTSFFRRLTFFSIQASAIS